jgi:nitroreductase
MMLQAVREELGTCIVATYDEQEVKEILTVPYSMRVPVLMLAGHAAEQPGPKKRLPLRRIVSFDHW